MVTTTLDAWTASGVRILGCAAVMSMPASRMASTATGDLEGSIAFYSKLFGAEPAKRRPGYANFAITEPPLKLVLIEGTEGEPTRMDPPRRRGCQHRGGHRGHRPTRLRGPGDRPGEGHLLLLRPAGQGLGARSRRRALASGSAAKGRQRTRPPCGPAPRTPCRGFGRCPRRAGTSSRLRPAVPAWRYARWPGCAGSLPCRWEA